MTDPHADRHLGEFDLRFSYPCQPFELQLDRSAVSSVCEGGIGLTQITGSTPTWVIAEGPTGDHDQMLTPHLLIAPASVSDADKERAMTATMQSAASQQPFGWMEGCVLDGMLAMATCADDAADWRAAAIDHLERYLGPNGDLAIDPGGIESMLMLGAFTDVWPTRSVTDRLLAHTLSQKRNDGIIRGGAVTAEGAYTVAYPLMRYAVTRDDPGVGREAIRQLIARVDHLPVADDLYLRSHEDGSRTFKNWSRAYAWYMLGIARTFRLLAATPDTGDWNRLRSSVSVERLRGAWDDINDLVIGHRQPAGLWACFTDDPETGVETSGSAGIAAAIGHAGLSGLTDRDDAYRIATSTYHELVEYVTPDGLLTCVAQHNAGGESLQRNGYRVIAQYGLGLLTNLRAVIEQFDRDVGADSVRR